MRDVPDTSVQASRQPLQDSLHGVHEPAVLGTSWSSSSRRHSQAVEQAGRRCACTRISACPAPMCRESLVLEVAVGKFLDTSLIRADVQPRVARLLIKGRLLQLVLPAEVGGCLTHLDCLCRHTWCGALVMSRLAPRCYQGACTPKLAQSCSAHGSLQSTLDWSSPRLPLERTRSSLTQTVDV